MDEKMVSLRINDIPVTVPEGSTVLEAARSAGFNIPSLCFLKDINEIGACRCASPSRRLCRRPSRRPPPPPRSVPCTTAFSPR